MNEKIMKLLLWLCLISVVVGDKVLVVFPVPDRSHSILGDSIVKTLLTGGYEVSYVTIHPKKASNPNLNYIDVSSVLADNNGNEHPDLKSLLSRDPASHHELRRGSEYVKRVIQHDAVQRLLMDPAVTFDVVIADWFHTGLLAPLAEVFQCPLVWYTAGDVSWQSLKLVHEVPSAAYTADYSALALSPPIHERAQRLWLKFQLAFWSYYYTNHVEIPIYDSLYRTPLQVRTRILPDYEALVYNASLLLVNSHPPLAQALPMPQNTKHVGGHHLDLPVNPLPKNLQNLLDKAQNGVIFVNLGPNMRSKDIPQAVLKQLLQLFSQQQQTVLWRLEGPLEYVPRNVHVLERTPQLGVLSHPNTVLFITDGSSTSIMDATYCGVPVIGIPFLSEQFLNMAVAQGYAKRVDYTQFVAWNLHEAIAQIIGNHSFYLNAKQASATFKQRLLPAKAELLHWIQLVLETRGALHLRSPAVDLPAFERYHLDIALLILLLLWFLSKVIKVVKVHLKDDEDDKKIK